MDAMLGAMLEGDSVNLVGHFLMVISIFPVLKYPQNSILSCGNTFWCKQVVWIFGICNLMCQSQMHPGQKLL